MEKGQLCRIGTMHVTPMWADDVWHGSNNVAASECGSWNECAKQWRCCILGERKRFPGEQVHGENWRNGASHRFEENLNSSSFQNPFRIPWKTIEATFLYVAKCDTRMIIGVLVLLVWHINCNGGSDTDDSAHQCSCLCQRSSCAPNSSQLIIIIQNELRINASAVATLSEPSGSITIRSASRWRECGKVNRTALHVSISFSCIDTSIRCTMLAGHRSPEFSPPWPAQSGAWFPTSYHTL